MHAQPSITPTAGDASGAAAPGAGIEHTFVMTERVRRARQ